MYADIIGQCRGELTEAREELALHESGKASVEKGWDPTTSGNALEIQRLHGDIGYLTRLIEDLAAAPTI